MSDPWKHRAIGMRCQSCMWFVAKALPVRISGPASTGEIPADSTRGALGRCRRHAPSMSGFPAVFEADWCGDHKLDETKL